MTAISVIHKQYVEWRENGYWIIESRVSLDSVVYAFLNGTSPEGIVQSFPVLTLEQVYGAIAFYLANRQAIDAYLKLRTFEFLIIPNYENPWKMLIHELEESKQYRHLNLVETPIFKEGANTILIRTTPLLISIIGTVIFVALALVTTFVLGNNSAVTQAISSVGTALGIISFFLIYFPIRGK